jgi:hypothetical protein
MINLKLEKLIVLLAKNRINEFGYQDKKEKLGIKMQYFSCKPAKEPEKNRNPNLKEKSSHYSPSNLPYKKENLPPSGFPYF